MHVTRSDMILKAQKGNLKDECENRFKERYSGPLGKEAKFVRLEGELCWLSSFFYMSARRDAKIGRTLR
jgi:hypothetical protein